MKNKATVKLKDGTVVGFDLSSERENSYIEESKKGQVQFIGEGTPLTGNSGEPIKNKNLKYFWNWVR